MKDLLTVLALIALALVGCVAYVLFAIAWYVLVIAVIVGVPVAIFVIAARLAFGG
jgi:hypothetical protein